jgi:hypothetical protein
LESIKKWDWSILIPLDVMMRKEKFYA